MRTILISIILFTTMILGQSHELRIMPRHLMYMHSFDRTKHFTIENISNSIINIDSIKTNNRFVLLRFRNNIEFPFSLSPGEKLIIDVILNNIEILSSNDTNQSIKIYNTSSNPIEEIQVNSGFYNMDHKKGVISGFVFDENEMPIPEAKVYFFIKGSFLFDSVQTDNTGYYQRELSYSKYLAAAKKDGFYMEYFNNKEETLLADFIELNIDTVKSINFNLKEQINTGLSISGVITAAKEDSKTSSKIVIVKKGKHTPSKVSSSPIDSTFDKTGYLSFVKSDGSYNIRNIIKEDNYIVQVFSNQYLPTFYHSNMQPVFDPNKAENIYVNSHMQGININLESDSAYGGGTISGTVDFSNNSDDPKDVMIFAKSSENNKFINYGFVDKSGVFQISDLPYGNYNLVGYKGDYNSVVSEVLSINTENSAIQDVKITFTLTSINVESNLPENFHLSQNYPNPFNPSTFIEYNLPKRCNVTLRVFDLMGKEIAVLVKNDQSAGNYLVKFEANNLASGVYVYQIQAGKFVKSYKMLLVK